jgi:hypothetical protein
VDSTTSASLRGRLMSRHVSLNPRQCHVSPNPRQAPMQLRVPKPDIKLLRLCLHIGQALKPPRVLRPGVGSVLLCVPRPRNLLLQLHPPEGRDPEPLCVSESGRALSSSSFLTSRATTRRGRQGTFKPIVGSWTATTMGMVSPLCHDSTWLALCLLLLALLSIESSGARAP